MHSLTPRPDAGLVSRLVSDQFPEWAGLHIRALESTGTQHSIYRLGERMVVRLPSNENAVGQAEMELHWLSGIAQYLPLKVSVPLVLGQASEEYPWSWGIYEWIDGETADVAQVSNINRVAAKLAEFLTVLHRISASDGPTSGRGTTLTERDPYTRKAIEGLRTSIDAAAATAIWERALSASPWNSPLVWTHGDLLPGNLLINQGELTAIIDFGDFGLGDPACDLLAAWSLFSTETREVFRTQLAVDAATWERGRGWALSISINALWYYHDLNPHLTATVAKIVREILSTR